MNNLKEELALTIIEKVYKNDNDNKDKNLEYLLSLSEETLDIMLQNYYLGLNENC